MADIVTVTMNPAVDITLSAERVTPTSKVRCGPPHRDPGGGGLNVARVLRVLGESVTALFPSGGHNGRALEDLVASEGVKVRSFTIAGSTRESFTVDEESTGLQYRFVLPGPPVAPVEQQTCLRLLREVGAGADFVVASGSLPPGVPSDYYQSIADVVAGLGARLVVDTSGEALRHLHHGAYLLKMSGRELRERIGRDLTTLDEQSAAAGELVSAGVCEVAVVSLGADGALLVTAEGPRYFPSVEVPVVSGVGAGDSMVAGITAALRRGWSLDEVVRYGVAAGSAMLLTPGTQLCSAADVERFYSQIRGDAWARPHTT
ncbi:MAG: 1-phosphofructokinase family hexose kinase [Rhodococcus sp. (in: high G+C Gram-positive bacteria)]|uniref:1-phosphofructokinase family hexose kinase n=1 Tax=Rhodococcus sp. TaxID=1831 RepID=UPI003BAFC02D